MSSTRRDVSWAVMLRLARTGVWIEWSKGHRSSQEVVAAGELPAKIPSVQEIRFERTTLQRDVFDLSELAEATGAHVRQNPLADRDPLATWDPADDEESSS